MAGKRLLDAARLLNASTSIAKQHITLRRQQWDLFTQTSGVAKLVKSQTDRITLTAGAAFELAKRFSETGPAWEQSRTYDHERQEATSNNAREESRSESTTSVDATNQSPTQSVQQQDDAGARSSLRKRELQRLSELQIPVTVSTQNVAHSQSGYDTFNERPEEIAREPSSLPRVKIPKHADTSEVTAADATGSRILNQDVYPSPEECATETEEGQLPEGFHAGAFASAKVSRSLGGESFSRAGTYDRRKKLPSQPLPEMIEASARWRNEREAAARQAETDTKSSVKGTTGLANDAEAQALASALAEDIKTQSQEVSSQSPERSPSSLRESRVPSTRFGRLWQYGGLATGMAFGAMGEGLRRFAGGSGEGSLMLSESNINRLVAKLSRMRGAALKLGQMISFQDSKVLPATVNTILQRVQDSADYMPASQRDKILIRNLGHDWRNEHFLSFEEVPFAAASIGQVHKATLKSNGKDVAVKIQYPGVKNSIDSDLNNLSLLLTASQLLPKGLFLDKTIANARTELGWECDYEREAKACIRFRDELVFDEPDTFAVPQVYQEASGPDVLTAEFMHGTAVTKIVDLTQEERDWIGTQILRLCLRELMEWRFMQTDPNWTNFLYNRNTKRLELLDFGASRDFPDKFVEPYVSLLIAASNGDRNACRDLSVTLGYLTGNESKAMLDAHIDSVLTLSEPFTKTAPEFYDFENQTITDRVRANIGLMLRERMAPPPEETYSLHRKLSGAFLLCARLKSKVPARDMFATAVRVWEGREKAIKL